jgi:2-polyprenyl-6-methoxyphenol hydroxylase-like FAD-dependent oxidoreductase
MSPVRNVLIVGGGIAGMSAALRLRAQGLRVVIAEADPEWRVYGAGISITGPTLRAFRTLGILEEVARVGFASRGLRMFTPSGRPIAEIPGHEFEPGVPSNLGILRPDLHRILSERTLASGAEVRLGVTVATLDQAPDGVEVALTDGTVETWDLVIGADGVGSPMRQRLFPDTPAPRFTGQGCWRLIADRPPEVDGALMYLGGAVKLGLSPVNATLMYMYLLEHTPDNPRIAPEEQPERLRALMAEFTDPIVVKVRDGIRADSQIVYRPLDVLLTPLPWSRGRVGLIGDAVHATTPHLASGAGLAVEDAIVLAESLATHDDPVRALDAFAQRRFERARLVVESSVRLGEIEMSHGDPDEHRGVFGRTVAALAAPI